MTYELRIGGTPKGRFDTERAAVAAAGDMIREDADAQDEIEIVNLETGQPCAPGASKSWREALANKTGF